MNILFIPLCNRWHDAVCLYYHETKFPVLCRALSFPFAIEHRPTFVIFYKMSCINFVKFETVKNYTTFCTVFTTSIISNLIKIYSFLKYCIYHKYKFCTFLQWLSGLFYLSFLTNFCFAVFCQFFSAKHLCYLQQKWRELFWTFESGILCTSGFLFYNSIEAHIFICALQLMWGAQAQTDWLQVTLELHMCSPYVGITPEQLQQFSISQMEVLRVHLTFVFLPFGMHLFKGTKYE